MIQIPQANNTPITIYSYWKDAESNYAAYKRTNIVRSHFNPVSIANKNKHGTAVKFDAKLRIFDIAKFKTFSEFQKLPFDSTGEYWTLNPGTPSERDMSYIVLGAQEFDFTPGTTADIDEQVREFKKAFPYDNYRAELVDPILVGTPRMWHIAVSLKRTV